LTEKILVTGASGHLGSQLLKSLSAVGLARNSHAGFIQCDLTNKEDVQKQDFSQFDCVIHLASFVPKTSDDDLPEKSFMNNLLSTKNLVQALKEGTHLIFASTCETYGKPNQLPLTEKSPLNPTTYYGASKVASEKMLQVHCKTNNIKLTILRFTSIYGPGESINRAIPNFIRLTSKGEQPTIYGDGSDKRDFLYIDDAVGHILSAIEKSQGGIYNIATGTSISIKEVADKIIKLSGNNFTPIFLEAKKEKVDYVFSIKKAQQDLNYTPKTSLEEGFSKQILWFKKNPIK
jgi:nucleoside-diphosphate-sugar epimerase